MLGSSGLSGGARALVAALPFALSTAAALLASAPVEVRAEDEVPAAAPPAPSAPSPDAPEVELPEVVIRAPGRRPATDPTSSATVVDAKRFEGEEKSVAELVGTAPGVAVSGYGGLGQLATVSIRGATSDGVLVLLDGMPLNTAFGGGVDLSTIPRAWISSIEIVRGAEGARYGAGALGGVVNVVTRNRPAGTWALQAGGGSFETFSTAAEGAAAKGPLTLFGAATMDRTGGAFPYLFDRTPDEAGDALAPTWRDNNAALRGGALAKLSGAFGDWRLDGLAQLSGGRRELAGLERHLTHHDWQEDARGAFSARLSGPGPAEGLRLAGRASLRLDALDTRLESVPKMIVRQRGAAAGLAGEAHLAHANGQLRVVVEGEAERLRATGVSDVRTRGTIALALSDELELAGSRLRLAPAVRAERIGAYDGMSARLGATFRVAGPIAVCAGGGRTFRAPSFAELYLQQGALQPNPELVPERGTGADVALVADGTLGYASAGAHATLYDELIYYQLASRFLLRPFNAGRTLVRGLELEAASVPVRRLLGLAVSASYTLLDTELLRATEAKLGNEVPHRARHRLYARASIAPGRTGLHLEAHRVGRQFADDANISPIPATLLWNAGASLRLGGAPAALLSVEVKNLGDDRTLQDGFGNPLPGRMVLVTLRASNESAGAR